MANPIVQNPVPPGRYWIDLIGEERIAKFGGGIQGLNDAHPGLIRVISATRHLKNEVRDYAETGSSEITNELVKLWEALAGEISDTPERDWVLFEVAAPAMWDFQAMGTPSVAGPNVKSESDTVQEPDLPLNATESVSNALDSAKQFAETAMMVVGAAAVVVVLVVLIGKGKK